MARTPARQLRHLQPGDASVPLVCDLELTAPTRVPNSAEALRKGMYVIVTCQRVGGKLQAITVHIEYRHPRSRRKRS